MKPVDSVSDDELARIAQRAAALPDPPPALLRAALDLWPTTASSLANAIRAGLRLITAALSFDSWAAGGLAAAGVRGGAAEVRHLLFAAQGRDIDLRISPNATVFALAGQILGPDEAGIVALEPVARDAAAPVAPRLVALDEFGEFRFDEVAGGTYLLTLRVGSDEIELPPLHVGVRP